MVGRRVNGGSRGSERHPLSVFLNHQHAWVFALVMVALVFWAFRLYRRVPPAVGPALRRTLLGLRVAAIAVVVFVLLEPVIRFTKTGNERPVVAVLLDDSRSMAIDDGTGGMRRGDEALALLNEVIVPRVARDADVRAYRFSDGTDPMTTERGAIEGEPGFNGELTDIPAAFLALRRDVPEGLGAIVLATDGAGNRGGSVIDAWRPLGVPVYALGVGSEMEPKDISVREVLTNRMSYAGEALPVEVTLSSAGFQGASSTVELSEDGKILDRATVDLSGTGEESTVRFSVVPSSSGVHRYAVEVPAAPGELSDANNRRVVATNTLGGKVRVLLAATRPGLDYAFIGRELASDGNVELTSFAEIEGAATRTAAGPPDALDELLSYDLVVLVDPDWSRLPFPADWLVRFVRERGGGLLVTGLPPQNGGDAAVLLPVTVSRRAGSVPTETRLLLTADGETSPVTRVADGRYENAALWEGLPPVWTALPPAWVARPEATVLAAAASLDEGEGTPVVVVSRSGAGNVAIIAAVGLWRWKMAGPSEPDVLDAVMANTTRWLTARGELTRVAVETDKDVYSAGESVRFSAQVYGGDYRLARDASVTVEVAKGEGAAPVETLVLSPDGDFYRGEVGRLTPGRYLYVARGEAGGESMGESAGEFVVDEFSLEDAETRRRPGPLRRLAEASGGAYVSPETIDDLPESVQLERRRTTVRREFEAWNSSWPLVILVGLLSAEWAVRRRKGMP